MNKLFLVRNVVASFDNWAVYPNFGRRNEIRYEQYDLSIQHIIPDQTFWMRNHILIIEVAYGSGDLRTLAGSGWRWEPPHESESISDSERATIINRVRKAYVYLGMLVDLEPLEISAGFRKKSERRSVIYDGNNSIRYESRHGYVKTIVGVVTGSDLSVKLSDINKWDPPNDYVDIDMEELSLMLDHVAEEVSRHNKNLVLLKM